MKVIYDTQVDILTIVLNDAPIAESDEEKPGIILDYDAAGNIVSLEVLDASTRIVQPKQITFELTPA